MIRRPRMKPTFKIPIEADGEEVFVRLKRILQRDDCPVTGDVLIRHAFVQLPREERSMLSPYLNLSLVEDPDGTHLIGRFSPHPHVWTGFMAVYGILGMLGLAGLIYGWAQSLIGGSAMAMWAVPMAGAAIAFVYGAAIIGQGLTADEMYILRYVVDRAAGHRAVTSDYKPDERAEAVAG